MLGTKLGIGKRKHFDKTPERCLQRWLASIGKTDQADKLSCRLQLSCTRYSGLKRDDTARAFVWAGCGEIAGDEEEDGFVSVKIFGVEDAAVFGAGDFEAVLFAEFGDGGFGDAETMRILFEKVTSAQRFDAHTWTMYRTCIKLKHVS